MLYCLLFITKGACTVIVHVYTNKSFFSTLWTYSIVFSFIFLYSPAFILTCLGMIIYRYTHVYSHYLKNKLNLVTRESDNIL